MEPVNASCETWREVLAAQALGGLGSDEMTGLSAHLEGCRACRDLAREFAETVELLGYVDPAVVEHADTVPVTLSERVLGNLARSGVRDRRRRRTRVGAGVLVGVAAVAVLVVVLSSQGVGPESRTLALKGASSVTANAVLVGEPWGTSLTLSETGLPAGGVYTVSMKTASGAWWVAGTYRSVSGVTMKATMSCAVTLSHITGLRVVNQKGVTVLTSFAAKTDGYN